MAPVAGARHEHVQAETDETDDTDDGHDTDLVGVASSAAARGIGGSVTPLAVWAGYWSLAAVLFLLPNNRTSTSVHSAIAGMAPSQPGWYGHVLTDISNQFTSTARCGPGSWPPPRWWGAAPLLARRAGPWLLAGAVFAFVMWMSAQGLFGNVFTGSDTDPNTGPLVILLGRGHGPHRRRRTLGEELAPPGRRRLPPRPALVTILAVGIGAALALAATYPPAAPESAGSAMSGMEMGGSSGEAAGSNLVGASTCHPNQVGLKIAGLDLANTPYMIMSGPTAWT